MLAGPEIAELLGEVLHDYAGNDPAASAGPLLVVQGEVDESVPPPLTADLVDQLCAAGVPVVFRTYPDTGHDAVMAASAADTAAWMAARLADEPPESTCP
jgi:predicted esterase